MPEIVVTYALTTKGRVKDRLIITGVNFDTIIERLISSATDFIERACNRRFKRTTYTNEVYQVRGAPTQAGSKYIFLKQSPVSTLTALQYRAGTITSPSWTNFLANNFELVEDGTTGIIAVYGGVTSGINQVRATYDAGYLIDFANAGSATHTLPFDLSDLCERLVTKLYKRKESEGRQQEAYEGGSVSWKSLLDEEDKETIARHTRPPQFV